MFVPKWLVALVCVGVGVALLSTWTYLLASGRNPLPFPDPGSRIFTTPSPEAKDAMVALLARHGIKERFEANSSRILRSIMWDGTIINYSPPEVLQKLGHASASIGLVSEDLVASAKEAAQFLRSRGFEANVVTNATSGTVLNFRKHVIDMPRDQLVSK